MEKQLEHDKHGPVTTQVVYKSGWGVPVLFILVLVIAGVGGAAGYFGWLQLVKLQDQQQTLAQAQKAQELKQQVSQLSQTLSQALAHNEGLQQQVSEMAEQLKKENYRVSSLSEQVAKVSNHGEVDWQLDQLEYYTLLANKRLKLTNDLPGAIALLEESITIAKDIEEPQALGIMQALESDRSRLSLVDDVNVEHVFIKIDELVKQIDHLVMPEVEWDWGQEKQAKAIQQSSGSDQPESAKLKDPQSWSDYLDLAFERTANLLSKTLIRTQTLDEPIKPLLQPDQRVYLKQNLQLILEQAQLAALRRQGANYSASLAQAERWVKEYFRSDNRASQFMLENIKELKQLDLDPQIPEISSSIDAVKAFSKEWLKIKEKRRLSIDPMPAQQSQRNEDIEKAQPEGAASA